MIRSSVRDDNLDAGRGLESDLGPILADTARLPISFPRYLQPRVSIPDDEHFPAIA